MLVSAISHFNVLNFIDIPAYRKCLKLWFLVWLCVQNLNFKWPRCKVRDGEKSLEEFGSFQILSDPFGSFQIVWLQRAGAYLSANIELHYSDISRWYLLTSGRSLGAMCVHRHSVAIQSDEMSCGIWKFSSFRTGDVAWKVVRALSIEQSPVSHWQKVRVDQMH